MEDVVSGATSAPTGSKHYDWWHYEWPTSIQYWAAGRAMIMHHNFFHPFVAIGIWFMIILTVLVYRTKGDLPAFIDAINHLGDQWMAIIVISVGCIMLVMCKEFGLDSTIAGGIIGVGSNMLQNRIKDQANSQSTTEIKTVSSTIPPPSVPPKA